MSKAKPLTLCDVSVQPGEKAHLALPFPEYYSCSDLYMPITVLHGKTAGPCVLIFSAVLGNELNGIEIITRLLEHSALDRISGTIIAIPVLNPYGLIHDAQLLPGNVSIRDCFPGDLQGSFGERIAYHFAEEILTKADACIELQTGDLNHALLPQIFCDLNDSKIAKLAKAFRAPVICNADMDSNSLRSHTQELGIPMLIYRAGEASRFDEAGIQVGLDGLLNLLCYLSIIDFDAQTSTDDFKPTLSTGEDWLRAPRSGVLHSMVELGEMINQGQLIANVNDPFSADIANPINAPLDGIIVGINRQPLLHEGERVFKIASFVDNDFAESVIEKWGEQQPSAI